MVSPELYWILAFRVTHSLIHSARGSRNGIENLGIFFRDLDIRESKKQIGSMRALEGDTGGIECKGEFI